MAPVNSAIDLSDVRQLGELAGVPLYEVVKRHISENIVLGKWVPGTVLPGEVALAHQLGVAVGTARRALAELTAEGLLSRRRKTGTVVTGRSPHHSLRSFFQYFRLHGKDGSLIRSKARVISVVRAPATKEQANALDLSGGVELLTVKRVRDVDGMPVMIDDMTVPSARVPGFPEDPKCVPELILLFLLDRYGIRVSAAREQVTAELATAADISFLHLKPPAAVLVIAEVAFDQSGAPTLLAHHRARTDSHCYINEIR